MSTGAEAAASAASREAEALAAPLPPLLVAAERVAATVAQGVHGRRRVGQGDSFWQFRPFAQGDTASRIDWRQSAKSDRTFIRETEWEAAQTVYLWRDASAGMGWRSALAPEPKRARAETLLLALAALLLRGGERVRLLDGGTHPATGRAALLHIAAALAMANPADAPDLPPPVVLPRHARVVLVGDFLAPLSDIRAAIGRLAAIPVGGHLLQVLDPAETSLPYEGRVRFRGVATAEETLIPRVDQVRGTYAERLAAQIGGIRALCAAAGWSAGLHRTDQPASAALLGLYTALAPPMRAR